MLETQPVSLKDWAPYQALAGAWTRGDVCLRASGLWGSARALVVGALLEPDPRPCLVLVSSLAEAPRWAGDRRSGGGGGVDSPAPDRPGSPPPSTASGRPEPSTRHGRGSGS